MKILELKIEGFRSLKSVEWKPGDINILIGPNAGGKSNLLQAMEMIAESAKGKLDKFVKEQGGMGSIVWDGKAKSIKVWLDHQFEKVDTNKTLTYRLIFDRLGDSGTGYIIGSEYLIEEGSNDPLLSRSSLEVIISDFDRTTSDIIDQNQTSLSLFKSSDLYLSRKHENIAQLQKYISSWNIYSHFDTGPEAKIRQAFITSHDKKVESDGQNFIAVLHTLYEEDREFKQEINSAMKAAFGDDYEELSFPPAAQQRSQLALKWKSLKSPQYSTVLSDGTLRFLYLLTILADPDPPALIAIDEPEAGLHPRMLPIIAEYALEASRRTQVILATHSPEMLSAFGKRQSEVTVTVAQWEEGQTKLKTLEGEKLDYWLKEYTLGELFRSGELEDM